MLIGVVLLMPSRTPFQNETHTFRWATGPDLNNTLCATVTSSLYRENSYVHSEYDRSRPGE